MDIVSKNRRSEMMAGIRASDTKPELKVRRTLHHLGYRYRLKDKVSGTQPDVLLRKQRVAIFVHGCFWHRHQDCKLSYSPNSRKEFWEAKFHQNIERDIKVNLKLQLEGWRIAVIWECATRNKELFEKTMNSLNEWIKSSSDYFESQSIST